MALCESFFSPPLSPIWSIVANHADSGLTFTRTTLLSRRVEHILQITRKFIHLINVRVMNPPPHCSKTRNLERELEEQSLRSEVERLLSLASERKNYAIHLHQ
ncbi:hypothetical protein C4D60_Mb08t28030 [Musa balbisiana]|uniref:Uncharacterized protein n=1 Tax=Musa balbisiana TaxID=52838 RepID=A0A4S8K715_MUSBA|nr:hypothetical protein C4D60_Mb08t28030 [Musa balbisiana]